MDLRLGLNNLNTSWLEPNDEIPSKGEEDTWTTTVIP